MIDRKEVEGFIVKLSYLKNDFANCRMFKTMHKIDDALKEAGWELASKLMEEK